MTLRDRIMARSTFSGIMQPAFTILDALQRTEDPAAQMDVLSLVFTAMCQSSGLDPHELIVRSRRQLRDGEAIEHPEIQAIRDYAAGELT